MTSQQDPGATSLLLHYVGRVQGVGFRYTTRQISRRYRVFGYVKNLPDGSVELAVQGEPREVEAFLSAVAAAFANQIEHARRAPLPGPKVFDGFEIQF